MPTSRWMRLSSTCICSRRFLSSAPSGSSSSSTSGLKTRPRASATRCCWPPDSSRGCRSAYSLRPTSEDVPHARGLVCAGKPAHTERERHVARDGHVREQRVVLEDHPDGGLVG